MSPPLLVAVGARTKALASWALAADGGDVPFIPVASDEFPQISAQLEAHPQASGICGMWD